MGATGAAAAAGGMRLPADDALSAAVAAGCASAPNSGKAVSRARAIRRRAEVRTDAMRLPELSIEHPFLVDDLNSSATLLTPTTTTVGTRDTGPQRARLLVLDGRPHRVYPVSLLFDTALTSDVYAPPRTVAPSSVTRATRPIALAQCGSV